MTVTHDLNMPHNMLRFPDPDGCPPNCPALKPKPPDRNRTDLLWLAVDLDGTLAESQWPHTTMPGMPIHDNVIKLKQAVLAGWKVVIHTARPWGDYETIEWWLNQYKIPWHRIVCGKLLAVRYIDDRNTDPNAESWIPSE